MPLPIESPRRISPMRVVTVTLGLAAAGGVAGAVVGMVTFAAATVALGEVSNAKLGAYLLVGSVGAGFGLTLGPLVAWTLLRRVPLGRAVLFPTIGAAIGSAIGLALSPLTPLAVFIGGIGGLLLAAWRLRVKHRG